MTDRLLPLCDLLLGAAYADGRLDHREQETVRELLLDLAGGALPDGVDERIRGFDAAKFDVKRAAAPFKKDSLDDRRKLLYLVDAIHEADDEIDLAESGFVQALAAALEVPAEMLAGLTLVVEEEVLRDSFQAVRRGPPPVPGARAQMSDDVEVELD